MVGATIAKKQSPFSFVIDELSPIRPTTKQMFGFTYVYLEDKLLLALRQSEKQPKSNGIWLFTHTEHLESLRKEFTQIPRNYFWKSGKNGWVILNSRLGDFEECAFKACELILRGDPRVGRVTRGSWRTPRVPPPERSRKRLTK